jgi:hypothetical protein
MEDDLSAPIQPHKVSEDDCEGSLHPQALIGLELFNQARFFEAHEALEIAWRAEKGPIRDLYRGILQVGVGFYHIERGNYVGARKLFLRCRQWLDPFPDHCRSVDVARLRRDFLRAEAELIRLGPDGIAHFNQNLFPTIVYTSPQEIDGHNPPL